MPNSRSTLLRCLALLVMAPVALCAPSVTIADIYQRDACPGGPDRTNYQTLAPGDNCQTLAEKFNTSTLAIETLNNAGPQCTQNFIAGTKVCIPPPCNAYKVQEGDTCQKIVDSKNVAGGLQGFYANNPDINNPSCSNLILGYNVCLSTPTPTGTGVTSASAEPISPTANVGTDISPAIHCTKNYTAVALDMCDGIADKFNLINGVTNYFYNLNPTVHNPSCDNINIGQVYCVANATTTSFAQPKSNVNCTKQYKVKFGDICMTIAQENGLANANAFLALNPGRIDPLCTNLVVGLSYCVAGTAN